MPSYNQVQFIERSILSVLYQSYKNFELIIIDGGSTDGTIDIIRKYEKDIAYWVSENDYGQSDALNKGFAKCTGDIYGWLNSDDIYLAGAFEHAVTAFSLNSDKSVVFGDWLSIDGDDEVIDYNHAFDFNLNHFVYEGFHLSSQSLFWRSRVHAEFSGFDVSLYNTMDYQMILEFSIKQGQNSFYRTPYVLGAFRRYEGQKTSGVNPRVKNEHQRIAERYGFSDKFELIGRLKRVPYRFRRAYWYIKRGGISNLIDRMKSAYFVKS